MPTPQENFWQGADRGLQLKRVGIVRQRMRLAHMSSDTALWYKTWGLRDKQLVDEPRTKKMLKHEQNDLYKLHLVFVKGDAALGWTSQSKPTSPAGKAAQKLQKYQHLEGQVQELTNVTIIKFMGFPLGGIRAIMSC